MANTATKVAATTCSLSYSLVGDGTVVGPTIASATLIADCVDGPLKDLLSASYANQAAMQAALLFGNPGMFHLVLHTAVLDATGEANQCSVNVDVDAVTATRPEVNITMSDTTGQTATLLIEYRHSITR